MTKTALPVGPALWLVFTLSAVGQTVPQDSDAKLISAPEFHLSESATAAGIDGTVVVDVIVEKSGTAKNVTVNGQLSWPCASNPKDELSNVMAAIKQNIKAARFSPSMKNGKPRESSISLVFAVGDAYRDAISEKQAESAISEGKTITVVNAGVVNGRASLLIRPKYPYIASALRLSGIVPVHVRIDATGRVVTARALSGPSDFYASARDAACRSRFSPTTIHGRAVSVTGIITYDFAPNNNTPAPPSRSPFPP